MVVIDNTNGSNADYSLANILYSKTREYILKIAKRLDLYVSPNITKAKMSARLADEILTNPIEVVSRLSRTELLLLEEFLKADEGAYIVKKARKTEYMLQKLCLVITYDDEANGKWHMIMPAEVRKALMPVAQSYIQLAKAGQKGPSAKQLRMKSALSRLFGHDNFIIDDGVIINLDPDRE